MNSLRAEMDQILTETRQEAIVETLKVKAWRENSRPDEGIQLLERMAAGPPSSSHFDWPSLGLSTKSSAPMSRTQSAVLKAVNQMDPHRRSRLLELSQAAKKERCCSREAQRQTDVEVCARAPLFLLQALKMFLKLLAFLVVPGIALPEDDHALTRDDECSDDKTCSVQALQMRHSKSTLLDEDESQDACSGAGELPSSDDLCYTGSFLVEKFFVKLSKQTATSGSVDLQAVGPKATTCNGAQYQQSGSDITVEDTTDCGLVPGTDYTVKYCSNQDEIVVHMLKPMDVSVVLSRTPCAEAKPQLQALLEEHAVSESERGCSSYGTFPRGGVCYSGAFLVESLYARVVTQGAHHGYVNMKAVGPKHGQCYHAGYSQHGQYISVNAAKCGLSGMSYTIRYCPDQDVINLQITAPLAGNVVMRRSGCSGVLLEESQAIAEPVLPSPMGFRPPSWVQDLLKASTQALVEEHAVSESERGCSGYGTFPRGGVCYSGAFLVESLYARVVTQGAHHGYVNMKAVGPKHGQCYHAGYSQHGQYISVNAAKCGLSGMSYTIRYCPDQDVINLQITAPLAGNVVMRRSGCSGVLLEESQAIAEPVPPSPVAVQPPSWMQNGVSTAVACSGEKALPKDSELCYQGTLLVETLSVRVLEHTENGGTVNMKAVGPQHGECKGAVFHQSGSNLTINDAKGCGLDGAEYKVQYCSDQDQVVVRFVKPMQVDVALARAKCEASLA
ncbi:unnamed protein product [Symbiodinium sp. CCMP2456]|nr:unnamed protein product [Symbiodinium sp. CCMP2456]